MDNLENALTLLFKRISVQDILNGNTVVTNIKCDEFVQLMRSYSDQYSDTELKNLYHYLVCNFVDQFHTTEYMRAGNEKLDVFKLLQYYANWILTIQDNEIVCKYAKFLHWRMITIRLCEDLFTTSFLASRELQAMNRRVKFDWKTVITHNNRELRKILDQGISENHSHLKGTAPVFQLTWISMMNNLDLHTKSVAVKKIDSDRRNVNIKYSSTFQELSFSIQLLQAAYIRLLLFRLITNNLEEEWDERCRLSLTNEHELLHIKGELSDIIHSYNNTEEYGKLPDYAILGPLFRGANENSMTLAFQGERWLLYVMFSWVFSGNPKVEPYKDLFYAYLVLKENFRGEIVQSNSSVGFENFSIYEKRKDIFLEDPFFEKAIVKKAVETSLFDSNVVTFEGRIAPKMTADEMYKYIQRLDNMVDANQKYRNRFFYTVHFIKAEEKISRFDYVMCRHWEQRNLYIQQAYALVKMRENYPSVANRVRGIDAANMEIGCGPEVFAQVFRYLSDHTVIYEDVKKSVVPQLRITYHVGEDYLDLVSGLRAIDEAIKFLGMKCGDRLGHALALGVDVEEWYNRKNRRVILPQQEYIDNLAWLYHLIVVFDIPEQENIKSHIVKEFNYYFQLVYGNSMDKRIQDYIVNKAKRYYKDTEWERYYKKGTLEFNIENYYSAWKLRADNPELYREGFFANKEIMENSVRSYQYYSINRDFPIRQNKRFFPEIGMLYYYYHYDGDVRYEGAKPIEIKIPRPYIECIKILQKEFQKRISKYGIAIETNPSSNFLIGTFKSYAKHPIVTFYNQGLVEESEEVERCPQLNVSINTDDAGIFSTSLENEYAFMALALEKEKDEEGNFLYKKEKVYTWIDNIRKMGLRQTFLSDGEMKRAIKEWKEVR